MAKKYPTLGPVRVSAVRKKQILADLKARNVSLSDAVRMLPTLLDVLDDAAAAGVDSAVLAKKILEAYAEV